MRQEHWNIQYSTRTNKTFKLLIGTQCRIINKNNVIRSVTQKELAKESGESFVVHVTF